MDALVTLKDIQTRMGLPDDLADDAKANLRQAISAAQLHLESRLATRLATGSYVDHWRLDGEQDNGVRPGRVFTLIGSTGFVDPEDFLLEYSDTRFGGTWNPLTLDTDYFADWEQGRYLVNEAFEDSWVRATYGAGYEAGDELPEWLREAILSFTPVIFTFGAQALAQKEETPAVKQAVEHAMAVADKHRRRIHGLVYRPL